MKARLVSTIILLSLMVASAAGAYTLNFNVTNNPGSTTYNYSFTPDMSIVAFHIYSPVLPSLIDSNSCWASNGWESLVDFDPYSDGCDIYWYGNSFNLGKTLQVSFTTMVATDTVYDWAEADDVQSNWAYETISLPGWAVFQTTTVPVPSGISTANTPEPGTIVVVLAGLAGFMGLKRRK